MTLDEAWTEFQSRVSARYGDAYQRYSKGASNLPFLLENGFRFGLFNVDSVDAEALVAAGRSLVLATRLILPPRNVLHLALVFSGDGLRAFGTRKDAVRQTVGEASKVRVLLHQQGIFLRQGGGDDDVIDPSDPQFGPALRATEAHFADVERDAELPAVEADYVRHLASLLGETPLSRLGAHGAVMGGHALSPATIPIADLKARIAGLNALYSDEIVERYHAAMNHLPRKHFVLLTGISGTGKTLLTKAYAYAVFDVPSLDLRAPEFHLIAVRPDWTEPSHLIGYMDTISGRYHRTRFVNAVVQAVETPHRPVFVCLDEMNLAQPEHYFADVLSSMESKEPLHLHTDNEADAGIRSELYWPNNLYLCGTVNMDETTRPFSPKVLDRANVIDMRKVDLNQFRSVLVANNAALREVLDDILPTMRTLQDLLQPHGLHFGYRTVEEIANYVAFARTTETLANALDLQIEQKILTKLRGGRQQKKLLGDLYAALAAHPTAQGTVKRMDDDLERDESFDMDVTRADALLA